MSEEITTMTMLENTKIFLDKRKMLTPKKNNTMQELIHMIDVGTNQQMAEGLVIFAMSALANNLRYRIDYSLDNEIPINVISFILAHSGSNKTSSERTLRRAFKRGYVELEGDLHRSEMEVARREEISIDKIPKLNLFSKIGTGPGFIKRINDFESRTIGIPTLIIDEIATEFELNSDVKENIQIVAELFDAGELEDKPLKDSTNQAKPISKMGITALMMGSEASMYGDSKSLQEFKLEFSTKLSRRCFFIYPTYTKVDEKLTHYEWQQKLKDEDSIADTKMRRMNNLSAEIVTYRRKNIQDNGVPPLLKLEGEARNIYLNYRGYCKERGEIENTGFDVTKFDEIISLEMKNRHWKMLKLAAVFTVFRKSFEISVDDLHEAISFAESLDGYLHKFLTKAEELPHEKLAVYVRKYRKIPEFGEMKKRGWIKRNEEVRDLCESANYLVDDIGTLSFSFGVYVFKSKEQPEVSFSLSETEVDDKVKQRIMNQRKNRLESISDPEKRVNEISKLKLNIDVEDDELKVKIEKDMKTIVKAERAKMTKQNGWTYHTEIFRDLVDVVSQSGAISAFEYTDGIRLKTNCLNRSNLLILDVDKCDDTMHEVSDILGDINHIIATSSDNKNPHNFRILIKLDKMFDFSSSNYRSMLETFIEEYGIAVDVLGQEQLYLTYKNAKVITNFDGEDFNIDSLNRSNIKKLESIEHIKVENDEDFWNRRRDIFPQWFKLRKNGRNNQHRNYGLALYAIRIGVSLGTTIRLITEFHNDKKNREGHLEELIAKLPVLIKARNNE